MSGKTLTQQVHKMTQLNKHKWQKPSWTFKPTRCRTTASSQAPLKLLLIKNFVSTQLRFPLIFTVNNSFIFNMSENTIHPAVISDHVPVSPSMQTPTHTKMLTRWRLNTSLLGDPDIKRLIKWERMKDSVGRRSLEAESLQLIRNRDKYNRIENQTFNKQMIMWSCSPREPKQIELKKTGTGKYHKKWNSSFNN